MPVGGRKHVAHCCIWPRLGGSWAIASPMGSEGLRPEDSGQRPVDKPLPSSTCGEREGGRGL